jgi:hypothetical protein
MNIDNLRETIISGHFTAACAQLQSMVEKEPLRTSFKITEGCVSKEIADELAVRFIKLKDGYKAEVCCTGAIFITGYSLRVTIPLPENLIHISGHFKLEDVSV